jgi:hypothetical protein
MTLRRNRQIVCSVCDTTDIYFVLMSTNSFGSGSPDLDTRPTGMARGALLGALTECSACGHIAPDISESLTGAREIVSSEPYRAARRHSPGPRRARQWHCWALLCDGDGRPVEAGLACLSAAWASDDALNGRAAANRYRAMALDRFGACASSGLRFAANADAENLLLCDLHRRIGNHEEALAIATALVDAAGSKRVRAIANFQRVAASRGDTRRYSIAAALRPKRPRKWWGSRRREEGRSWWQFWR